MGRRRPFGRASAVASGGAHIFRARAQIGFEHLMCMGGARVCTDMALHMHRRRVGYAPPLCWVCTDIDLDRWAVENAS